LIFIAANIKSLLCIPSDKNLKADETFNLIFLKVFCCLFALF
jgi:hypothetical protein